ncbi:MAG: bifunctional hydroxymethylpyrimidine kinase/phosphomethylpyrimidine kinase [Bacteroidota bacterium]
MKIALTIAGSDSGGGAGIQADIKSMQANGVFAASVVTAVTAQNTLAVTDALDLPLSIIESQIDAVFDDLRIDVVKTGMLSSSEIIRLVARKMREREVSTLVVDPVMVSKSGFRLLAADAVDALRDELLPLATVVTPNAFEAGDLTGGTVKTLDDAQQAAREIFEMGPSSVLVKGGHLEGETEAIDVFFDGAQFHTFTSPMLDARFTHGTGCTYASAIAARLARGASLTEAISRAKHYVTEAIRNGFVIGSGHGPTHHFYFLDEDAA